MAGTACLVRGGRTPCRRKKTCIYTGLAFLAVFGFIQFIQFEDRYTPLQPLPDAESEAKRLLKFITHYHYQCNTTVQVGNRSHWPICSEKDTGIDLESKEKKVLYTIGNNIDSDFGVEKYLATNHSFEVYILSHTHVPNAIKTTNHTRVTEITIVPNDPADFSRNSYEQATMNSVLANFGSGPIDLLKISNVAQDVSLWELVHFMILDNLILDVQQLHLAMYIDKLDDSYLYNWYRVLHDLFYKQGLRLYHTSSRDSLCLQVTLMQSCLYYLSFVRDPGPHTFILHPPADYGDVDREEFRLVDLISEPQVECKQTLLGGSELHFHASQRQSQWAVCSHSLHQVFNTPCSIFRFSSRNDPSLEQTLIHAGCSVTTLLPLLSHHTAGIKTFKLHTHQPTSKKRSRMSEVVGIEDVLTLMQSESHIDLVGIDVVGYEWQVLALLLDSSALKNVSQLAARIHLWTSDNSRHPTLLRSHYSQLQRLGKQGFSLFHSQEEAPFLCDTRSHTSASVGAPARGSSQSSCFQVGYVKKGHMSS